MAARGAAHLGGLLGAHGDGQLHVLGALGAPGQDAGAADGHQAQQVLAAGQAAAAGESEGVWGGEDEKGGGGGGGAEWAGVPFRSRGHWGRQPSAAGHAAAERARAAGDGSVTAGRRQRGLPGRALKELALQAVVAAGAREASRGKAGSWQQIVNCRRWRLLAGEARAHSLAATWGCRHSQRSQGPCRAPVEQSSNGCGVSSSRLASRASGSDLCPLFFLAAGRQCVDSPVLVLLAVHVPAANGVLQVAAEGTGGTHCVSHELLRCVHLGMQGRALHMPSAEVCCEG